MKVWDVTFELNCCAEHEVTIRVKANTDRKAIIFASRKLDADYNVFHKEIRDVKEVQQ